MAKLTADEDQGVFVTRAVMVMAMASFSMSRPRETKSWVQRVVVHGRRRDIGLGGYPAVSLAEARERCTDNRKAIAAGLDPIAEKHKPTVATFREAAETVHEMKHTTLEEREACQELAADA